MKKAYLRGDRLYFTKFYLLFTWSTNLFFYFSGFIFTKKQFYFSIYKNPTKATPSKGMYIATFAGLRAIRATIDPTEISIGDIYYFVVLIIKRKMQTLVWALA